MAANFLGIEIGGTKLQLVSGDESGRIHQRRRLNVQPREGGAGPRVAGFHERMKAGAPFRDPSFLKLA